MIYFTSDSTRPHPALMRSSLEHRLIPVGGGRFIETHFNIRQQVCPVPWTSSLALLQQSGQVFSVSTGNIIIKADLKFLMFELK